MLLTKIRDPAFTKRYPSMTQMKKKYLLGVSYSEMQQILRHFARQFHQAVPALLFQFFSRTFCKIDIHF